MNGLPELPGLTEDLRSILGRYAAEVVRWNRSINLVSRRDPGRRVADLLAEAVLSWQALRDHWSSRGNENPVDGPWCYVDLGSGGGFPGLVWSLLFHRGRWPLRRPVRSFLVEPREKRVAFLERQARLMDLPTVQVLPAAWHSVPVGPRSPDLPPRAIITMKALALSDEKVRDGWRRLSNGKDPAGLVLVRFSRPSANRDGDDRRHGLIVPGTHTELEITRLS